MRIEIWDKTSNITEMGGLTRTPEEIFKSGDFPIDKSSTVVLEYIQGTNIVGGIDNLAILRQVHNIDTTLSDEEAFKIYKNIRENPPEPVASNNLRLGTFGEMTETDILVRKIYDALLKKGIIEE